MVGTSSTEELGDASTPSPTWTAGAAGGAVQTAQRLGAAVGTAVLATVFHHAVTSGGRGFPVATSDALSWATGFMLLALLSIVQLIRQGHRPEPRALEPDTAAAAVPAD
jgi:hypothetical protein